MGLNKFVINLINSYQKNKRADAVPRCKYYPSCSEYGKECFEKFNFFKASILTVWRILRCNPFSKGGYDPVPEKKKKMVK